MKYSLENIFVTFFFKKKRTFLIADVFYFQRFWYAGSLGVLLNNLCYYCRLLKVIRVTALDADEGNNAAITYNIMDGADGKFIIEGSTRQYFPDYLTS